MKKILSFAIAALVAMTMSAEAISVAEALQIAGQLEKGATTEEEYEIEGYVTAMQGSEDGGWAQYGNQNFWIADDKESSAKTNADGALEIYQGVASEQVYVGDKVSVKGKLTNYNGLLETAKRSPVTILEKGTQETIIPEPEGPIGPMTLNFSGVALSDWTITNATLNEEETHMYTNLEHYAFDIQGGVPSVSLVTSVPHITFTVKNNSDKKNAFAVAISIGSYYGYYQTGGKNGVITIKNTTNGDVIRLKVASKSSSTAANFADPEGVYPKNARALTEDLTLPARNSGTEGEDEIDGSGYVWRTIEYKSFGGNVEIKEFAAGFRVREIAIEHGEPDSSDPIAVTCAEAAEAMPAQSGSETEDVYIVTGYVTNTNGTVSPSRTDASIDQQTFYMDDVKGSKKTIQGYWCNLPGHEALNVGDKITLTGKILNYNNTPEIKNGDVAILERAEVIPVEPDTIEVNVAEAVEEAMALDKGAKTEDIFAVTGYVQSIAIAFSEQYGNISIWMADEKDAETSAFEAYRVKCTAEEAEKLVVNAKITVISQLQRYYKAATESSDEIDLAETVAGGSLIILETPEPIVPSDPIAVTCAEALAAMPEQDRDTTDATYIVTGYVTETIGTVSRGQQRFWMDDVKGGENVLQGYWCNLPEGEEALNVGDKITLTGRILNYQGAPEIKNGDVAILERAEVIPVEPDTIEVTVAEAIAVAMALEKGAKTEDIYAVTGYIQDIAIAYSEQYNNISLWMADEKDAETSAFEAYRVKCTAEEAEKLVVNAKVTVIAQLQRYYRAATESQDEIDLAETVAGASLVILESPEPIIPSEPIAVTCAEAAAAMPEQHLDTTAATYIVTGYVTETLGQVNKGRQRFWMGDVKGGSNVFQGYWCNLPAGENALNEGDKITVTGRIMNYNNTPEISYGDIAILERAEVIEPDTIKASVLEVLEIGKTLEVGQVTKQWYEITGYVSAMAGQETDYETYGDQLFWIADEKGSTAASNEEGALYIYRGVADEMVKAGYKVTLKTPIKNYNGIIESETKMEVTILEKGEVVPEETPIDCQVVYVDIDEDVIGAETVTLHLPAVPEINNFTFIGWQTAEAFIDEGIVIQAIYEYTGDESVAPAEVKVDDAHKLIRNGNVYILREEKTYTITGQQIR